MKVAVMASIGEEEAMEERESKADRKGLWSIVIE